MFSFHSSKFDTKCLPSCKLLFLLHRRFWVLFTREYRSAEKRYTVGGWATFVCLPLFYHLCTSAFQLIPDSTLYTSKEVYPLGYIPHLEPFHFRMDKRYEHIRLDSFCVKNEGRSSMKQIDVNQKQYRVNRAVAHSLLGSHFYLTTERNMSIFVRLPSLKKQSK